MAGGHTPKAFTVKANGRLARIITDISICEAFDPASPPDPLPQFVPAKALWDTGATRSVISKDLAAALGLKATGVANVTHGGGCSVSPRYVVNFALPHGVRFIGVLVTEFPSNDPAFNVILGMD